MLHAAPARAADSDAQQTAIERTLRTLLAELPLKQAVALAATLTGAARNRLYEQALAWRDAPGQGGAAAD